MLLAVSDEVAKALELEFVVRLGAGQGGLDVGGHHFEAVRVEQRQVVLAARVGLGIGEQAVVQAHFGRHGIVLGHPGDGGFDFDAVGPGGAAFGVGHHGGQHFGDLAVSVFFAAGAFDDVAAF